jgi:hypothetical protein
LKLEQEIVMLAYLTQSEIALHAADIEREFTRLMAHPRLAVKKSSTKQWDFFRHCFKVLMDQDSGDFACESGKATDYTYEILSKLREYYSKPTQESIKFKFWLDDGRGKRTLLGDQHDYACSNGYLLLIIPTDPALNTINQVRGTLSRVIDDAMHAEYEAYRKLELKPGELDALKEQLAKHFVPDEQAYEQIVHSLEEHGAHKEIISNSDNPSTRPQLKKVESVKMVGESASVNVVEYWNLHWFSAEHKVYVKTYHGQNKQTYTLINQDRVWKVQRNTYNCPRGLMYNFKKPTEGAR